MNRKDFNEIAKGYAKIHIPKKKQYAMSGTKLTKRKLEGPIVGNRYALYFNLQAMYNGTFGQIPHTQEDFDYVLDEMDSKYEIAKQRLKFRKIKREPTTIELKGPTEAQRANTFFSGAVYSFKNKSFGGRIIGYGTSAILENVVFAISKSALKNIKQRGDKSPCCYAEGTYKRKLTPKEKYEIMTQWNTKKGRKNLEQLGWRQIIFNPKAHDNYQYLKSGKTEKREIEHAYSAKQVLLLSYPIDISKINFYSKPYLILGWGMNVDNYQVTEKHIKRK